MPNFGERSALLEPNPRKNWIGKNWTPIES
jgi:hypothetical protein